MLVSVADVFKTENHTVIVIGQLVVFPGGYTWEFVLGLFRPVLHILTLRQTKKKAIFHIRFQIWPLKSVPDFRPGV